jgi:hypothetical protein
VAGTDTGLMSASPDRPAQPVAVIADGPGDLDRGQVLGLIAGQRDQPGQWRPPSAVPSAALRPGRLDRCRQLRVCQQPVQHRQVLRQLADLHRQQLINNASTCPPANRIHAPRPDPWTGSPSDQGRQTRSADYFRGK